MSENDGPSGSRPSPAGPPARHPKGAPRRHPALVQPPADVAEDTRGLDTVVFGVAAVLALALVIWGFMSPSSLGSTSSAGLSWVVHNVGWFFVLLATVIVVFVLWLGASKYGRIPLGRDDEAPEFRTISWIAMMFSAGMGIGLMFFGVAEPLAHFVEPPPGTVEGGTDDAVRTALATTLFHWTLHPWAIYAFMGLAVGYGVYRRGRRQLLSSAFVPLFGRDVSERPAGKVIDTLAVIATLFGTAASLGFGALQIGSGVELIGWVGEAGNAVILVILAILTAAFVVSAFSGIAKGIQYLSNINVVLAFTLALFVFVLGPTVFILNVVPTALGAYFDQLAEMAARTEAVGGDAMATWLSGWTVFYWAWWISWTPFVGIFIARISRGRTIRQFVAGVLLVPSAVSVLWFAIFGGAAIDVQRTGGDLAGRSSTEAQLFGLLEGLPLSSIATVLVMLLISIFFITGADSASVVMASLSERGNREPRSRVVIFWGVLTGSVAAVMMLAGGDEALQGLQNLTIIGAVPFAVVIAVLMVSLAKDLRSDPAMVRRTVALEAVRQAVVDGLTRHGDDFVLAVEHVDEADGAGDRGPAAGTPPTRTAEHRTGSAGRTLGDVDSPVPDRRGADGRE
ncbi:BCCT family transporter [Blastococcus sp. DSM 46786]|uniref:BCCT family transporter n=1 Tax=Blastococcus sp. DSM 46786 TaxID=1798227 RepID=UPI000B8953F9|nr:BCCT family transporter [Blastococcus sp. DSM 46786]